MTPSRTLATTSTPVGLLTRLRALLAGETPTPSPQTISYSGAFLYGSGATLVLISILVERSPLTQLRLALPALAIAYLVTAGLALFPELVPLRLFPYLTALGTLLIAVLAYADGSSTSTGSAYSLLYVWVALYSFHFYSLRTALLQTLWVSVAALAELVVAQRATMPFSLWLLITGTSVVGGMAIRQLVMKVRRLADHDDLTGLNNRRSLHEQLERDLHRAERSGEPLSLLILDLDHFKEFNDARGHLEGDRHLREVADAWAAELRGTDMLARFGGEEFIVLMPSCSIEMAEQVCDRLRATTPNNQTASAGVASWDGEEDSLGLIARADSALYEAKLAGRNRTVVRRRWPVLRPSSIGGAAPIAPLPSGR